MQDDTLSFYILTLDGRVGSISVTYEGAIEELSTRIAEDDSYRFGIERFEGIWNLIKHLASFFDYEDEWMDEVLRLTHSMVEQKRELLNKQKTKPEDIPKAKSEIKTSQSKNDQVSKNQAQK